MDLPNAPGLLTRVRDRIRLKHYSIRTEHVYVDWIRRFIHFHGKRHPASLGSSEVEAFLTDLAVSRNVAAATQNQAKSALLFLYKEVLDVELPWLEDIQSARASQRLPGLRVKDMDFERGEILVRDGKGLKDRVTVLPRSIVPALRKQADLTRTLHARDLKAGYGEVWLPFALQRKYRSAAREWGWQYVFPAEARSRDPRSGVVRRDQSARPRLSEARAICVRTRAALPRQRRTRCSPSSG